MSGFNSESTAGDSLLYHSGHKFSTPDQDNDESGISCSLTYTGAFWFDSCNTANPLGVYGSTSVSSGIMW